MSYGYFLCEGVVIFFCAVTHNALLQRQSGLNLQQASPKCFCTWVGGVTGLSELSRLERQQHNQLSRFLQTTFEHPQQNFRHAVAGNSVSAQICGSSKSEGWQTRQTTAAPPRPPAAPWRTIPRGLTGGWLSGWQSDLHFARLIN